MTSFLQVCVLLLLVSGPLASFAQDYPSRPLRFYVGAPPGSSSDLIARLFAEKLRERLGQPVVVENRPGASAVIGIDAVAKAPPDGYALGILSGGHPTTAAIWKKLPYDPVNDLAMISLITEYPIVLSVRKDSPIESLADFIARAKAAPGKLSYAMTGAGLLTHMFGEWVCAEAGIDVVAVQYKGGAPALMDLLGARVDMLIETMTFQSAPLKDGRVRGLALSSGKRSTRFSDIPTISETLSGVEGQSWLGMITSPGTPRAIVVRLNREVRIILTDAVVQQRLEQLGGEAQGSSPEEMRSRVEREIAHWTRLAQLRKIERQ
jgi:tripartite-type tricarboxylate transporter receptor subunit TctC